MNIVLGPCFKIPGIVGLILMADLMASETGSEYSPDALEMLENGRTVFMASETENPFDSLHLVEKDRNGEIRVRSDVNWAAYTKVRLQEATVEFRPNWQRDQNRHDRFKVNSADMRDIKNALSEQFGVLLSHELSENIGFGLTDFPGENVLAIQPGIVDLDVSAPATRYSGTSRQLTDSSAKMTLNLELYDSDSGVLLAVIRDRLEDPHRGFLQSSNSVSNRADTDRMLKQWMNGLTQKLEEASNSQLANADDRIEKTLN